MKLAYPTLLLSTIALACVERRAGGTEDGIGDAGSTESSTTEDSASFTNSDDDDSSTDSSSDTNSSTSSEAEADVETGPFPDFPSELPADCEPVFIHEPEPTPGLTDIWSGWLVCSETGFRMEAVDCPYAAPFEPCDDCGGCSDDEQCLLHYPWGYCFCGHQCNTDSDCGPNEICLCRSGIGSSVFGYLNECIPAGCAGEADCGSIPDDGVPHCRLDRYPCGVADQLQCRTEDDDCTFDNECPCNWDQSDMRWTCDRGIICE